MKNFIVLEGIDGAGTTTQLAKLAHALAAAGVPHATTSEPTGRPEGALIRKILSGGLGADPGTVAHLFAADRHEHLYGAGGIVEHITRGETVVCDRYVLSSLAYQGTTCGPELPGLLNSLFPPPGLTLYFSIAPERSMARLGTRTSLEIYEKLHIQNEVCAAYEKCISAAAAKGWKIVRIDASKPVEEVSASVLAAVGAHLGIALA